MNKYDETYEIKLATIEDEKDIMEFIDKYWKKDHILAKSKELFEYEFKNGNNLNVVIARRKSTEELEAILCYLPCSRSGQTQDLWGSLWKVRNETDNMPFLGIELGKRLLELTKATNHLGVGLNPKTTVPIRTKIFKDRCEKMRHFYMLNPNIKEFKIAKIRQRLAETYPDDMEISHGAWLITLKSPEDFKANFDINQYEQIPKKDYEYIKHRYYEHPIYDYHVFGIRDPEKEKCSAIIVIRAVYANDRSALRIVDYLGEQEIFSKIGSALEQLILAGRYEYIDFYEHGFNSEYILKAGFIEKNEEINIIPNYFEPFVQSNVDMWVHYKPENTLFFKADSDQDRPNLLKQKSVLR